MANTYDLLLQPVPSSPLDSAALEAALLAAGAKARPDGAFTLKVSEQARAEVELYWVKEQGVATALDCRVPLSDQTDVIDAVVTWALAFAKPNTLRVMDPQLNLELTTKGSVVLDSFLRSARYAGEYTGVSDAVGASSLATYEQGSSPGARVLLALVVFCFVLYATFSLLTGRRPAVAPGQRRPGPSSTR